MGVRNFGAQVKRVEDPRLLTGRGRYVDDVRLPGMLEAAFVRSSEAHAAVRAIDVSTRGECSCGRIRLSLRTGMV